MPTSSIDRVTHLDNNFKLRVISAYFSSDGYNTIERSYKTIVVSCAKAGGYACELTEERQAEAVNAVRDEIRAILDQMLGRVRGGRAAANT